MEIPFGPISAAWLVAGSAAAALLGYLAGSRGWRKADSLPQAWRRRQRGLAVGAVAYWLPLALFTLWVAALSPFPQAATDIPGLLAWGALGGAAGFAVSMLLAKARLRGWWRLLPVVPVVAVCSPLLLGGVTLAELAGLLAFAFVVVGTMNGAPFVAEKSRDSLRTAEDAEVRDVGLRRYIRSRDERVCLLCGGLIGDSAGHNYDHARPHSRGGKTVRANLVLTHASCNKRKGASFRLRHSLLSSTAAAWERRAARSV